MKKLSKLFLMMIVALSVAGAALVISPTEVSAASNTKTTTTTSVKTSKKVIKLKKAVAKPSTTKKETTKSFIAKTAKPTQQITKKTTVKTTVTTAKKAKTQTVTTQVKTTVKTTTVTTAEAAMSVDSVAGKVDSKVIEAFHALGFTTKLTPNASFAGECSVATKTISLRSNNEDFLLHELGHFAAFASGNSDTISPFAAIYKSEAPKYNGDNTSYVTKNSREYFAESFRDYCAEPAALKAARPATYKYIQKSIAKIGSGNCSYTNLRKMI